MAAMVHCAQISTIMFLCLFDACIRSLHAEHACAAIYETERKSTFFETNEFDGLRKKFEINEFVNFRILT